ncbi:diacylglycerol kinase [Psychrobacter sp. ANT_WB68]|uniref:diacylglycerol kinase n=1 Tax=Psychrobacter sp. ANT_WB68 TaxID=2597355 RepID=UPI0011F0F594|nr:diacylglycerol kinase [Psychrobacter sp. ANT_WB68]KAA0914082.1 diacylglycerol kinase [Psychrobacter sp. ANT_WB68]
MSNDHLSSRNDEKTNHDPLSQPTSNQLLAADSYASDAKGKKGLSRIIKATGYSIDGFKAAYKFEAAFRQVLWLNLVLFIVIIVMPFDINVKMMLISASFLSLIVELFNTGIEASVDHTSTAQHPLAKIAKDVGSAAQFLSLLLLFILWLLALSPLLF